MQIVFQPCAISGSGLLNCCVAATTLHPHRTPSCGRSLADKDGFIPNPKLKLLGQVTEVMRLRHYSIRTEQCYCDRIRRFIKFDGMQSREELVGGGGKV